MRPAVAMLELIFALVVMGIVLMSAPRLSSTAAKSGFVALQQEAIATTAAEIGMILTRHWDERNTDPLTTTQVLTTRGDDQLAEEGDTNRRAGTPTSSSRTFHNSFAIGSAATRSVNFLNDDNGDNDFDDIDDFQGAQNGVIVAENANMATGDVVDTDITLTTNIRYVDDNLQYENTTLIFSNPFNNDAPRESSIKWISVTLTTANAAPDTGFLSSSQPPGIPALARGSFKTT